MIVLAVPRLFDAVAARFAAEAPAGTDPVPMFYGWNAQSEQLRTTARITWVPGDDSGNLGRIGPPKYPSKDQLLTLFELVTLVITSADITNLPDERKQYQTVRELHDAVLRAIHMEAVGTYKVITDKYAPGPGKQQRRFGQTIRLVLEVEAPITNDPADYESIFLTQAIIDAYELDHHEQLIIPREE